MTEDNDDVEKDVDRTSFYARAALLLAAIAFIAAGNPSITEQRVDTGYSKFNVTNDGVDMDLDYYTMGRVFCDKKVDTTTVAAFQINLHPVNASRSTCVMQEYEYMTVVKLYGVMVFRW